MSSSDTQVAKESLPTSGDLTGLHLSIHSAETDFQIHLYKKRKT